MVRIKHRYLLINILYPSSTSPPSHLASSQPIYLTFHRPTPSHLTSSTFLAALRSSISTLYGDYGLGTTASALKIIYFSPATSTVVLRCPRNSYRIVWAGLTYVGKIATGKGSEGFVGGEEVECVLRVLRVGGTVKKVLEEVARRGRREVLRARMDMEGMGPSGMGGLLSEVTEVRIEDQDEDEGEEMGGVDEEGEGMDEDDEDEED